MRIAAHLHTSRIPAHRTLHASLENRVLPCVACDECNDLNTLTCAGDARHDPGGGQGAHPLLGAAMAAPQGSAVITRTGPWPPVRAPQGVGGATPAPGSNPRGPFQPAPGRRPHINGLRCSLAPSSHHPHPPARDAAWPTLPQCPSRPPSPLCRSYGLGVARTANIHCLRPRTAHASPHGLRGPQPL